ncbi:MAG: FtsX-like permease family protein [Bacteroidales bacterium]|nr:FtsX-like permease family protein [Bacteroidales bacterium]
MLINYIKTAYRNMMRNFSQTLINILGLAIGMTCALLIFLWVQNQVNYDQQQEKKDRIYRFEFNNWVIMPPYIADLISEYPEIEDVTRLYCGYKPTISFENNYFNMDNFVYADSTIFNVFTFDFLYGSPENALEKPASIVLTKSVSRKFFGNKNPIGKEILIDNDIIYTVTGVIDDIKNLHLSFNAIVAAQDIKNVYGNNDFLSSINSNFLIYVLLKPNTNVDLLIEKIRNSELDGYDNKFEEGLLMRPFKEIYFERNLKHESNVKHGNYNLVLLFSAISFLILLIACINFINISTAKAKKRELEIGIRKIVGASRKSLISQFFGETFLIVLIAHIISIVLLEYALPIFNNIIGESIAFKYFSLNFLLTTSSIILLTSMLSGYYPALYLSSLKPVLIIKGNSTTNTSKGLLRKVLMTIQFSISIFLIIATIVIIKQLYFVLNKDLGWNQENIITFELKGDKFHGSKENIVTNKSAFTEALLKNPNIKSATYTNQHLGNIGNTWGWDIKGENYPMKIINADPEFIKTMEIDIIEGRNFSIGNESDINKKVIINEEAIKYLELENPIGYKIENRDLEIIGIVKDFNFNSLHSKIEGMGITWNTRTSNICIKVSNKNLPKTIKHIESTFNEFSPKYPFEYKFLDDSFSTQYKDEVKLSKILIFFALITIFIAGLGLFGMSSFIASTRTKEIGIRKTLGSSISDILILFSKDFIRWILIAFLIASPLAYYLVKKWLMQYPYQTGINWWVFAIALLITLIIALLTIGFQVVKTARTKPAECLRYE